MGSDDVKVAFDDHDAIGRADPVPRLMQSEEQIRLMEDRRFRRIHILGVIVAKGTAAEADDRAFQIADRKHQPVTEAVVEAAVLTLDHQPSLLQLLSSVAFAVGQVAQQIAPILRSKTKLPRFNRGRCETTTLDIGSAMLAFGRAAEEVVPIDRSILIDLSQACLQSVFLLLRLTHTHSPLTTLYPAAPALLRHCLAKL